MNNNYEYTATLPYTIIYEYAEEFLPTMELSYMSGKLMQLYKNSKGDTRWIEIPEL